MKEVLGGMLGFLMLITGLAGIVSVFVGLVMIPLCLIQWARGFQPRHTASLLLSGVLLLGTFGTCAAHAFDFDHAQGMVGRAATAVTCFAGVWGILCLLRSVPVNLVEMSKMDKKSSPQETLRP